MSIFSRLADLTREIAGATRSARDSIAEMRQEIATRRRALEDARSLPVPPTELVARFRRVVDERAERFRRQPPPGHRWTSAADLLRPLGDWQRPGELHVEKAEDVLNLLCFLIPEHLAAGAERLAEMEGWGPDGAPSDERPAIIARLERELRDLETAEEQAIDAAAAAGVVVEHRPEVRERRREDAYQQQRRADREAAARERQAEIDRQHEQRREPGVLARSHYLSR
jgi:hypothetical protein